MKAKLGKACLLFFEGLALCIALLAGLAFFAHWKISHGGLSLDLMSAPLSYAFEKRLSDGSDVVIGSLRLQRDIDAGEGKAGPLRIVAENLIVSGPEGQEMLELPQVAFRLRTGDLIRGRATPRYVDIAGAVLSVTRTEEGRIDFGIIRQQSEEDIAESGNFLDSLFAGSGGSAPDSLFEGAILNDTTVTFTDNMTGQVWRTSGAKAEVWKTTTGFDMSLDASFRVEGEEAWLRLNGSLNERREQLTFKVTARSAPVSNLVSMVAGRSMGERINATLSGSIEAIADFAGEIQSSRIDLTMTDGDLRLGDMAIPISQIMLQADYLPERRTFSIDEFDYSIRGNEGNLRGFVSLGAVEDGAGLEPETVEFNLAAQNLVVDLPGITAEPLSIGESDFAGRFDVPGLHLIVDQLTASYFGETIDGSMQILLPQEDGQSTGVIADASITGTLSPQEVLRGWPVILAPDARLWIDEQLPSARISKIDFVMDMPRGAIKPETALGEEMMTLSFAFDRATAYYVPGMTPITGARGSGILKGNSFYLSTDTARIGAVNVPKGEVDIPAFMPKGAPAYFRATLEGDLQDILSIIDEEPLRFLEQAGFSADRFAGNATFDFEMMRPQLTYVPEEDYEFSGAGTFTDVSIEDIVGTYDVERADGTLELDKQGMRVAGNAALIGLPVDYVWTRTFEEVPDINLVATGTLDSQSADDFGISLRQYLRGQVPFRLTAHQTGDVYDDIALSANLTDAQISLDMLNYNKAAGARGALDIALVPPAEGVEGSNWDITRISLDTDDLDIFGSVELEPDGELVEVSIKRLFIRDRADLRIGLARQDEIIAANIHGAYANIDLFGDNLFTGGGAEGGNAILPDDVRLSVKLDRLELKKDVIVNGYDALLSRSGGSLSDIAMSGDFAGEGAFVVTLENSEQNIGRELVVETDNLGAVAGGLFDISSIQGGTAAYRATLLTDGPVAGTLTAQDFRVANAPLIARLLSAGSLTGLSDILSGEGIEFTEVIADVQYDEGEMSIIDARATGPSLGVSVGGNVDFSKDSFDLNGAVAPAYGVNSMLGNIPGFGELLVSRKGEGVVAFSYMIDGPVAGPTVTVNALSLFTPGIFRRIFEPIRGGQPSTAELLDEAVEAAEKQAQATGPKRQYTASAEQMKLLRDNLAVFREQLEQAGY
ncbi:AsmA-like C-terminal region-containing protein [Aquisalinus flavus]|uniref:Membrane protein n=1 Tax=Aquisalinus flavus TaxID=1526572 RepID=A0A8J2Y6E0_9PROT|nr:AsmA-like C-terminal region-containing protein [Aquisalinus flavus]MBD0427533.1 hypothetical protein [Aquisalinus flavus]UNE47327.1 hypothetical protein FF099_04255 [Aquisalinus flavus]GGD01724.1 membrane protein [Aquisalinus flavus]